MKEIIVAEHAGFCFGVRQAIEKTEKALQELPADEQAYCCGPLIHNQYVTGDLARKGLVTVKTPEEVPEGAVLIVRSHGEPERYYHTAKQRGLRLIDATCPFVKRIHGLVNEAHCGGRKIVIAGDKNHPEVMGISGWCGDEAAIVLRPEEAEKLPEGDYFVVAQTTMEEALFDDIATVLEKKGEASILDTICSATKERQDSCRDTANKCDTMVIIGSKSSSNTGKLYEIARKHCPNSYLIENIKDLPLKEVEICNKIGVAAGASTPDGIIKEVIAGMSEMITNEKNETNLMHDLMEEIEKSLRLPRGGEIVTGTVIQVTDREIIVNLGCKKDGIIPKDELTLEGDQRLTDLFKEGDEIQAKVMKTDDGDGNILLSKKKLEVNGHWDEINNALEDKSVIEVKAIKQVKGGMIASYKEVSGFIPLSQLSDKFIKDEEAESYIGKVLPVKVTRVDQKKGKAAFSHRAYLMEERQKKIEDVWNSLQVDDIVEGTVMRFTDYGAFVDVGGLDGLLHISEISWGKLKHPQEVLTIGQKINVKVLSMNAEKGKISLGLKQTGPEPWAIIDEKYSVGQVVSGKVVQIKEYGAFVELEPGLDGLVHISEVAHKRVTNIADELSVSQEVSAKILEINKEKKRISLSIKETLEPSIFEDEQDEPEQTFEEPAEIEEVVQAEEVEEAEAIEEVEEVEAIEEPVEEVQEPAAEETEEAVDESEESAKQ